MKKLLSNPNFLFLFLGRLITNIGDSMYAIAAMWLVYDLTNDPFFTGLAACLTFLPTSFEFLLGPLVDRWSLKKILTRTQWAQSILILIIPISYYFNVLEVWIILLVMPLAVIIEQFAYPAQQALLPKIIEKEDLMKGNALLSFANQGTNLVFMGLTGVLIAMFGAVTIFLVDSITFIIAGLLFNLIKLQIIKQNINNKSVKDSFNQYRNDLKMGLNFVHKSKIPSFLVGIIIANFLFGAVNATLPGYADFRGGEQFYGNYLLAMSIGMLIGSIIAPNIQKLKVGTIMIVGPFISGIIWAASVSVSNSLISIILFGIALIPLGITNVLLLSLLQSMVPENLMGRVFAYVSSVAAVALPLGALIGGYVAREIGSENVFFMGSIANLIIGIYWLIHPLLRKLPSLQELSNETLEVREAQ